MTKKLKGLLRHSLKRKDLTIQKLADDIGISYTCLYNIVHSKSKGTVNTWEKVESYYNQRKGR